MKQYLTPTWPTRIEFGLLTRSILVQLKVDGSWQRFWILTARKCFREWHGNILLLITSKVSAACFVPVFGYLWSETRQNSLLLNNSIPLPRALQNLFAFYAEIFLFISRNPWNWGEILLISQISWWRSDHPSPPPSLFHWPHRRTLWYNFRSKWKVWNIFGFS